METMNQSASFQNENSVSKRSERRIAWIGEIPDGWEVGRLKYFLTEPMKYGASETGIEFDENLPRYIRITDIDSDGKLKDEGKLSLSENQAKGYILIDKTILFARSGGTVGKTFFYRSNYGRSAFAGYLISATCNKNKLLPELLYYYTKSSAYWDWANRVFTQATIQNIGADKYSNMPIPLPPLPAQQKIADFLDAKCAGLDSLSADIRAQIGLLEEYKKSVITEAVTGKRVSHGFESGNAASLHSDFKGRPLGLPNPCDSYKDSGIEWIGEIPEGWEVKRIGQLYTERRQKVSDRDYPPLSVTMKGIVPQLETAAKSNAHDDRKLVLKGDFAINSRSDRRGSCGISDFDGSVSLINTVLTPLDNMNPKFYNWLFHTPIFADEFYKNGHGIVDDLWTTSWQEMKRISIPLPPLTEQTAIADYLDSVCAKIDSAVSSKRRQLETLEEYKKSLIFEYVTGKKEVSSDEFALQTSQGKEV